MGLVAVAAIGATTLFLYRPGNQAVEAFYARPFELINQDGAVVVEANYLGKPSAWFYGFTLSLLARCRAVVLLHENNVEGKRRR